MEKLEKQNGECGSSQAPRGLLHLRMMRTGRSKINSPSPAGFISSSIPAGFGAFRGPLCPSLVQQGDFALPGHHSPAFPGSLLLFSSLPGAFLGKIFNPGAQILAGIGIVWRKSVQILWMSFVHGKAQSSLPPGTTSRNIDAIDLLSALIIPIFLQEGTWKGFAARILPLLENLRNKHPGNSWKHFWGGHGLIG